MGLVSINVLNKMVVSFISSKLLLVATTLMILTITEFACGNVEGSCLDGSCLDDVARAKRATSPATAVTSAVQEALMTCKLHMKIGLQPLDPLKLDAVIYEVSLPETHIRANFSNLTLVGMSTLRVQSLAADMSKMKLQFKLNFTDWNVTGRYNVTARFSDPKPVRSNDTFVIIASEVRVSTNSSLKIRSSGTLYVDDLRAVLEYGKARVRFHKLDKGGSPKETANRLSLEMARQVLQQISPKLLQRLRTALEFCLNSKLETVNIFKG